MLKPKAMLTINVESEIFVVQIVIIRTYPLQTFDEIILKELI